MNINELIDTLGILPDLTISELPYLKTDLAVFYTKKTL
jgi:hypothetical protein